MASQTFNLTPNTTTQQQVPAGSYYIYPQSKTTQGSVIVNLSEDSNAPLLADSKGGYVVHFLNPTNLFFTNTTQNEIVMFMNTYTAKPSALVETPQSIAVDIVGKTNPNEYIWQQIQLQPGAWKFYPQSTNNLFSISAKANGDEPYNIGTESVIYLNEPTSIYARFANPRVDGNTATLIYNNFTASAGGGGNGGGTSKYALLNAQNIFTESQYVGSSRRGLESDKQISFEVNATNAVSSISAGSYGLNATNKNFICLQSSQVDNTIQWKVGDLTNQLIFNSDKEAQFQAETKLKNFIVDTPTTAEQPANKQYVDDALANTAKKNQSNTFSESQYLSKEPLTDNSIMTLGYSKYLALWSNLFPQPAKCILNLEYGSFLTKDNFTNSSFITGKPFRISTNGGTSFVDSFNIPSEFTNQANNNDYRLAVNTNLKYLWINTNNRFVIETPSVTFSQSDFTFSITFSPKERLFAPWQELFSTQDGGKFRCEFNERDTQARNAPVFTFYSDTQNINIALQSIGSLVTKGWNTKNNITFIFTLANRTVKAYLNGVLVGTSNTLPSGWNFTNKFGLNIRKNWTQEDGANKVEFYRVSGWQGALSEEQIKNICFLDGVEPAPAPAVSVLL